MAMIWILRRRKLIKFVLILLIVWVWCIFYLYFHLDHSPLSLYSSNTIEDAELYELMTREEIPSQSRYDPLANLILREKKILQFYHLPKRKVFMYDEITTANRDTSYPLAPDFTFHLKYSEDEVVLFEDSGRGCIYRVFLFPVLPRNSESLHKVTSKDLREMYLMVDLDGVLLSYTLEHFMEGKKWPFLYPLTTQHEKPASGMGSYTPMCYQEHVKISYHHKGAFPRDLFNITVNCSRNDLSCPVHVYSAVSRHKFTSRSLVQSFVSNLNQDSMKSNQDVIKQTVSLLEKPETHGPDSGKPCQLHCVEMRANYKHTLLSTNKAGVISSIKLRVFNKGQALMNWNSMFLVAYFDGATEPQIRVPLGSIFGASGALNNFIGAAAGMRKRHCTYSGSHFDLPLRNSTAYVYFPMPFWKEANVFVEGLPTIEAFYHVCYQVIVQPNYYDSASTGYFNAHRTYYTDNVTGYRNILDVSSSWGHIVGLYVDVDNLKAVRNVPLSERWAALQADAMIFTDGSLSASAFGTGLEDYFSYAHGFANAENTTYSFVGVHFAGPRRSEPLTWYCYRHHVLDPVPFQNSIHFYMEGTSRKSFFRPQPSINHEEYYNRLKSGLPSLSHTVLYYARKKPGLYFSDSITFGDPSSEERHRFRAKTQTQQKPFSLLPKHYQGASNTNATFAKTGQAFLAGDIFEFQLTANFSTLGYILRRDFYSPVGSWNERATLYVGEVNYGSWVIPMGSLNEDYSLRQQDFILPSTAYPQSGNFIFRLEVHTPWYDLSYKLLTVC